MTNFLFIAGRVVSLRPELVVKALKQDLIEPLVIYFIH